MVKVPRLWPHATVFILASGPSLTAEDVDAVRGKARVVCVNDAVRLAPWADCLYSSDGPWWKRMKGAPEFTGLKFCIEKAAGAGVDSYGRTWPSVGVLRNAGLTGLSLEPTAICHYKNSGGAAINLAVLLGASRIILLGYDMKLGPHGVKHFTGERGTSSPYPDFRRYIGTMVKPLEAAGVDVVNASRQTALTCFPRVSLDDVLQKVAA